MGDDEKDENGNKKEKRKIIEKARKHNREEIISQTDRLL